MSIGFGNPQPPHLIDPQLFALGLLIGFELLLITIYIVDRLGTAMFKRGFAKPFYLKGKRIHHSCIYHILPASYAIMSLLFVFGFISLNWQNFWLKMVYTFVIVAATLSVDFLGDRYWPRIRKNVILHHEWVYTLVPAYIFLFVVNVVI